MDIFCVIFRLLLLFVPGNLVSMVKGGRQKHERKYQSCQQFSFGLDMVPRSSCPQHTYGTQLQAKSGPHLNSHRNVVTQLYKGSANSINYLWFISAQPEQFHNTVPESVPEVSNVTKKGWHGLHKGIMKNYIQLSSGLYVATNICHTNAIYLYAIYLYICYLFYNLACT